MAEVVRLLHTVISKVDGLATDMNVVKLDVQVLKSDVQVLKSDVRNLTTKVDRVESKIDVLNGQFRDVAVQAIKDTQRITSLEGRVDSLESKAN